MGRESVSRPQLQVTAFQGMVTVAPQMLEFFQLLRRVARTEATVLIRGETGTGKELAARALHRVGPRSDKPFSAVNCATLTSDLLASELFGHVRGAFTGAVRDHHGLFAQAHGGTVFLDEVAEIGLEIQARLLRVLQERTFVPLGGTVAVRADVRLLSATNKALREEVGKGRFREDLMYRVRVVPLFLPPLRERAGDVEALTWHFIDEFNEQGLRRVQKVDADAFAAMRAYPWPGNVRELRNAIEQSFALGEGPELLLKELPPELRGDPAIGELHLAAQGERERERRRIIEALATTGGRKAEAAELLGISRATLWRKMREHRL